MPLTPKEQDFVDAIISRLTSDGEIIYRSGGRAVGHQIVDRRLELVAAIRVAIFTSRELAKSEYRLGYLDALCDVLLGADIILTSEKIETDAREAFADDADLQELHRILKSAPMSVGDMVAATGKPKQQILALLMRLASLEILRNIPGASGQPLVYTVLDVPETTSPKNR